MLLVVYFLCLLAFGFVVTILASCVGALHCATGAVSRKLAQQKACLDRTRQVTGVAVQDMLTRWITFVCMVVGVIVRAVTWLVVTVVGFLKRVVSPVCNLVSALYEVATDAYVLNRCARELAAARSQNIMLRHVIQQDTHMIDRQAASIYARDEENNALTVVIREMEARLAAIKEELQCPISVKNFEDPAWLIPCGHVVEVGELMRYFQSSNDAVKVCPTCRVHIAKFIPANFPTVNILRIIEENPEELRHPQWVQQ